MVIRRLLRGLVAWVAGLLVASVFGGIYFVGIVATRGLPALTAAPANSPLPPPVVTLEWDRPSSVAVGTVEFGLRARAGELTPRPTASIAKVITVLVVASVRPLGPAEDGPTLRMTRQDVDLYHFTLANSGTNYPVQLGQEWTQRQVLEAILLVSANNLADSYAIWAFGSMAAYHQAAAAWLAGHDLTGTTLGADASGRDVATQSTTADLFELGCLLMRDPGLAGIVAQTAGSAPDGGTFRNTDPLIAHDGYVGIKTGTTTPAGACLLIANRQIVAGVEVVVVGVVLNETDTVARNQAARDLVNWALANIAPVRVIAGQPYGFVTGLDGRLLPIVAAEEIFGVRWQDETAVTVELELPPDGFTMPIVDGARLGTVSALGQTVPLVLVGDEPVPDLDWRLANLDRLDW